MSQPTNILIVDDNPNNLLSLRALIERHIENIHVFEADSGISALSLLMREKVDLIILDIQMPQMDGFETAKMIQSREKTQNIPIVFLTAAYKSDEFKKKGYDVGAADYLTKPIEPQKLTNKVKSYLRFIQTKEMPQVKPEVDELRQTINTLSGYTEALQTQIIELGYDTIRPDIESIARETQNLLELCNKSS